VRQRFGSYKAIPFRYHSGWRPRPITAPILIVDDVEETRSVLRRLLQLRGYATVEASSAGAAIRFLRDGGRPRLVILDMNLPDTSGRAVHAALKADPALAAIPVVVFSGLPQDEVLPGIVAYVRKGADVDELLRVVERACGDGIGR
jgi:CheY-like chemotaxis protein